MKITGIRSMRLLGRWCTARVAKPAARSAKSSSAWIPTAGIYGLGEADDFMGVRDAHRVRPPLLSGARPLRRRPDHPGIPVGDAAAAPPDAPHGTRGDEIMMVPSSSPTAVPAGPGGLGRRARSTRRWSTSSARHSACRRTRSSAASSATGSGSTSTARRRSTSRTSMHGAPWREDAVDQGFMQMKFDIDYVASDVGARHLEPLVVPRPDQPDGGAPGGRPRRRRARLRALRRPPLASTTCPTRSGSRRRSRR